MPNLENPTIRIALDSDLPRVLTAYERWDYKGGILKDDTVWIADNEDELIGVVRIVPEQTTLVLRGMRVGEKWRRQGVGVQILGAIAAWLGERECYCIPYIHLIEFYGRVGFVVTEPDSVPSFLEERLIEYRGRGLNVTIMLRRPVRFEGYPTR